MKNKTQIQIGKIEKGIPLPVMYKNSPLMNPMKKCEIGDSFLVESINPATVIATVCVYKRRIQMEFACRTISDTSVRVWRIEKDASPKEVKEVIARE